MRGILLVIGGFTLWVVVDALMKLAAEAHLPPYEMLSVMGGVTAMTLAIKTGKSRFSEVLWPKNIKAPLLSAVLGMSSNYFCVIALKHLPLTIYYVSVFTAPMMVAILAAFFLKESLGRLRFLAIVIGFLGVVIAINPSGSSFSSGDAIGYVAAFVNSALFAIDVVVTRRILQSENAQSLVFFSGLAQAIVGAAMTIFLGGGASLSLSLIFVLLLASLLNTAGNLLYTLGIKYTSAVTAAPYHYTQIISGALIGYVVWHEEPKFYFWIGMSLIVLTGIYIAKTSHEAEQTGSHIV
jgi:drug/metabolite transporter (DMT)-like permease